MTAIQPLILLPLLVLLAVAVGVLAWSFRRARRRRAEDRLVSEAAPRVNARLARLGGALDPEPPVPAAAPMAAAAIAQPAPVAAPVMSSPTPRPRSISSALIPWAGARAGTAAAASVAVAPAYGRHSGEAAVMQRAAMTVGPGLWGPESDPGSVARLPADPRWRMWRDASAALVAFALVGLVLVGGDLLRLPVGPLPPTPGLVAQVGQPSSAPTPTAIALVDPPVATDPPVLITPSPAPLIVTPPPTAAATPPETGPSCPSHASPRAQTTADAAKHPTPPPLDPAFFCDTYAPVVLVPVTCQVPMRTTVRG